MCMSFTEHDRDIFTAAGHIDLQCVPEKEGMCVWGQIKENWFGLGNIDLHSYKYVPMGYKMCESHVTDATGKVTGSILVTGSVMTKCARNHKIPFHLKNN